MRFGERVDAPPQVQLKRKHWAAAGGGAAGGGAAEQQQQQQQQGKAGARLSRIFQQQMDAARRRMEQGQGQQQQGQPQRKKAKQAAAAAADPGLRDAVIEAYRARRGTLAREGAADANTLKRLVAAGGAGGGAGL